MTDNHPITPPPERFKQWEDDILNERDNVDHVLDCAWKDGFRAGADQELEACCADIHTVHGQHRADWLRSKRRPKPPSLKEQALHILDTHGNLTRAEADTIRRALEALKEQAFHILDTYGNLTRAEADSIRRALEQLND